MVALQQSISIGVQSVRMIGPGNVDLQSQLDEAEAKVIEAEAKVVALKKRVRRAPCLIMSPAEATVRVSDADRSCAVLRIWIRRWPSREA
jgi:hypothetical protein